MRYQFIDAMKNTWPISLMCKLLEVSRPGYYCWRDRLNGQQADSNKKLDERIQEIYEDHDGCYGSPRITVELVEEGMVCSENRVARRMTQSLVCDALTSALFRRGFPKGVIVHSN